MPVCLGAVITQRWLQRCTWSLSRSFFVALAVARKPMCLAIGFTCTVVRALHDTVCKRWGFGLFGLYARPGFDVVWKSTQPARFDDIDWPSRMPIIRSTDRPIMRTACDLRPPFGGCLSQDYLRPFRGAAATPVLAPTVLLLSDIFTAWFQSGNGFCVARWPG